MNWAAKLKKRLTVVKRLEALELCPKQAIFPNIIGELVARVTD
jgi:hypothetical protein